MAQPASPGPPGGLPDVVPDFVSDLLAGIGQWLNELLAPLGPMLNDIAGRSIYTVVVPRLTDLAGVV